MVDRVIPVLMRPGEIITLKEAVFRTGRSARTISRWCQKDGIGRRAEPTAAWEISAIALEAKRYGDNWALDELRSGNFEADVVRRYAKYLGLTV